MRFEIIKLDVWGNADDGFEVNDLHPTGTYIEVEDPEDDYAIIVAATESMGWSAATMSVDWWGEAPSTALPGERVATITRGTVKRPLWDLAVA